MAIKFARESRFEQGFKETAVKFDINYGEHRLKRSGSGLETVLVKEFQVNSDRDAESLASTYRARLALRHKNLMALKDFSCAEQENWCSTTFNFSCYYEFHDQTLVRLREIVQDPSSEPSERLLTKLLYDMVGVLSHLQEQNTVHGDIRPELIFVSELRPPGSAEFKLLDRISDHGSSLNAQRNNLVVSNSLYVSPTLFHQLAAGVSDAPLRQPFKADAFSLGLVVLELGLLLSVQSVFDLKSNRFSEHYLRKYIEKFLCKYPDDCLLGQAVCFLLETNDDLRPDFVTLRNRMPDFAEVDRYFAAFDGPAARGGLSIPSRPSIFHNRHSQAPPITDSERNSYLKYFLDKKEPDPFGPDLPQDRFSPFENPFTFVAKQDHAGKNPLLHPQPLPDPRAPADFV